MTKRRLHLWIGGLLMVLSVLCGGIGLWLRRNSDELRREARNKGTPASDRGSSRQEVAIHEPQANPSLPTLYGRVIDDLSNGGVEGVVVGVVSFGPESERDRSIPPRTVTGSGGTYTLSVPSGKYELQAYLLDDELPNKCVRISSKIIEIPAAVASVQADIHFQKYPKVKFEIGVIDATTSLPIQGARVLINRDASDFQDKFPKLDMAGYGRLKDFMNVENGVTSETGMCQTVAVLLPGQYWISAVHEGHKPYFGELRGTGVAILPATSGQHYAITVRMDREQLSKLCGRFVSRAGQPIVGAVVTLQNGAKHWKVATDDQGAFTAMVTTDPIKVVVRHADYRTLRYAVAPPNAADFGGNSGEVVTRVMEDKDFRVSLNTVDTSGNSVSIDELLVAEADPQAQGELNPWFSVRTSKSGVGIFRADGGMSYAFETGEDSQWKIISVKNTEGAQAEDDYYSFQQSDSQVTIVVMHRK